jgi:hypothetical protein
MQRRSAEVQQANNYDGLIDSADIIPENAEGNNVQVEIKAGANVFSFHLKKPAGE